MRRTITPRSPIHDGHARTPGQLSSGDLWTGTRAHDYGQVDRHDRRLGQADDAVKPGRWPLSAGNSISSAARGLVATRYLTTSDSCTRLSRARTCSSPKDTKTGELIYTNSYYYIGHFSKLIRAAARRIASSPSRSALLSTAFVDPDGKVSVVMNRGDQRMPRAPGHRCLQPW